MWGGSFCREREWGTEKSSRRRCEASIGYILPVFLLWATEARLSWDLPRNLYNEPRGYSLEDQHTESLCTAPPPPPMDLNLLHSCSHSCRLPRQQVPDSGAEQEYSAVETKCCPITHPKNEGTIFGWSTRWNERMGDGGTMGVQHMTLVIFRFFFFPFLFLMTMDMT